MCADGHYGSDTRARSRTRQRRSPRLAAVGFIALASGRVPPVVVILLSACLGPRRRAFRDWRYPLCFQNPGNRGPPDTMADVLQRAEDPRVPPRGILFG